MKFILGLASATAFVFYSLSTVAETAEEEGKRILESNMSNEEICANIHNRAESIMQLRQNGVNKEEMLSQIGHNEAFLRMVEFSYQFNRYPDDEGMRRLTVQRFANANQEGCLNEMRRIRR